MRLDNWAVVMRHGPYTPPECGVLALQGRVSGHPRKADGKMVITSAIKGRRGNLVLTNTGSLYELGEPAADYAEIFPDALSRLLAALEEL